MKKLRGIIFFVFLCMVNGFVNADQESKNLQIVITTPIDDEASFFSVQYVSDLSNQKITIPFDIKKKELKVLMGKTRHKDIRPDDKKDFVWFQKKAPLRVLKLNHTKIAFFDGNKTATYLTFTVIIRTINEMDGQKSKLQEVHFPRDADQQEIELEYGKIYDFEIYLDETDNNLKILKALDIDVKGLGLFMTAPLETLRYQGRYLKVEYYSGPSISPLSGFGEYSFGWSNGITFTYSSSSPNGRILLPRLLLMNNLVITDPQSTTETNIDSSRLLNIGIGLTWLDAVSGGFIFYFANDTKVEYFLGLDFFRILNTFL